MVMCFDSRGRGQRVDIYSYTCTSDSLLTHGAVEMCCDWLSDCLCHQAVYFVTGQKADDAV